MAFNLFRIETHFTIIEINSVIIITRTRIVLTVDRARNIFRTRGVYFLRIVFTETRQLRSPISQNARLAYRNYLRRLFSQAIRMSTRTFGHPNRSVAIISPGRVVRYERFCRRRLNVHI